MRQISSCPERMPSTDASATVSMTSGPLAAWLTTTRSPDASEVPPEPTLPPNRGNLLPVRVIVIDPGNKLVVLGLLNPRQLAALKAELLVRLSNTGGDQSDEVVVALVTLLAGLVLVGFVAWSRRATT